MALRDQPYLPLYVQDFMSDEKLRECSAESVGVYIFLMCLMHKSEEYGKIKLSEKYICSGKSSSTCFSFATMLAKHLPFSIDVIDKSLTELLHEGVLNLDDTTIYQKRMVKDCKLSEIRALAGKIGGDKRVNNSKISSSKTQANGQAKVQANTVIEYEYENDIEIDNTSDIDSSDKGDCKEGKERKKKKKNKPIINDVDNYFFDETMHTPLEKAIHDFIEFRKSGKQPMTDNAIKLLISKLDRLEINGNRYTDEQKIEVLENSIMNGWTGIYELKSSYKSNRPMMTEQERIMNL